MESLDEMCDWYQAVADVAEVKYTAEDEEVKSGSKNVGDVKEAAYKKRVPITLPDGKAVGDAVTFTYEGETHTGVYEKETDIKHVKCKISDTADSKKIYGLFSHWDSGFDYLDDDVNDMNIAQVGTFIIRVNKDVTVSAGDLLVSNGDGTAKVLEGSTPITADVQSSIVAKVNSNIKVETYSDGSYTVPCTLHC
jgi:plastocyanin